MPSSEAFLELRSKVSSPKPHKYFFHLVAILFCIWSLYRFIFVGVPVVIDETIGKLIFFALPVWLYAVLTQAPVLYEELSPKKVLPGIFLGLAFGGLFGFVGTFATLSGKSDIQLAPLFVSGKFWWTFFLSVLTGFWESVFFFGWVFAMLEVISSHWKLSRVVVFSTLLFVLFHIPNVLVRFDPNWGSTFPSYFFSQIVLLFFFSIGQGFLFYRYRNLYLLTMTHAIWGTVLFVFGK